MENKWVLILGASSGFGGASAVELAKNGYNIFGYISIDSNYAIGSTSN